MQGLYDLQTGLAGDDPVGGLSDGRHHRRFPGGVPLIPFPRRRRLGRRGARQAEGRGDDEESCDDESDAAESFDCGKHCRDPIVPGMALRTYDRSRLMRLAVSSGGLPESPQESRGDLIF